jgi:prepilin-type N-terminal cleavage/methylation domain-containing protein
MYELRQSGYTIVEVVLVIAISAVMLGVVLAFQASHNRSTAFTTELDSINARISQIQAEANSNVLTNANAGTASNVEIFGKVIEFYGAPGTPNARMMRVSTLVSLDGAGRITNQSLRKCDQYRVALDQGVEYRAGAFTNQAIVFKSKTDNSIASTYVLNNYSEISTLPASACAAIAPAAPSGGGANLLLYSNYPTAATIAPSTINFNGQNNFTGRLQVNPGTNTITRSVP